ncbi:PQQ-binding-like beta-propeller repeat protein [Akkermansiaceae bacterium]|nr:PQQ-binding-like beta-propeller repeat protein [Akkermansiaceae bacterium]
MKRLILLSFLFPLQAADWPQWRGADQNNHAPSTAKPPIEWSEDKNVSWKTAIPGHGHSTPIFVKGRIYLTSADKKKSTQSLLCLDRKTGKVIWSKVVHQGGFPTPLHSENSPASASAQWDGQNILVTFQNDKKIKVTAISPDDKIIWSKAVGSYLPSYPFGFGSTPILHKEIFIVVIGTEKGGFLAALKSSNGKEVWKTTRAGHDYWATPVVATVGGKEQLFISGINKFSSYEPTTGNLNWEVEAGAKSMCGTIVWTDDMIFASGGFPEKETAGVKADGTGIKVWQNKVVCYEQSLLSHNNLIYAIADDGRAYCWDAKTGEKKWSEKLGRRGVMASPLAVGDHIYATLKNGTTVIFKASGDRFEKIAENKLGDDTYASPVALDNQLFLRVGKVDRGERQEFLYCLQK